MTLPSCDPVKRPGRRGHPSASLGSQTKGVAVVAANGTPRSRPSRAEFHRSFRGAQAGGDATCSRCSKQATASNASVTSRQACCANIFLRVSRFTCVIVVPMRLRRLQSPQHSFGLV